MIRIARCDRVLLSGLTLTNSPMLPCGRGGGGGAEADNLTVFGLTVFAPASPNTDGVDPAGSHQLIQNCSIACGDDNIAVKAGNAFCSDLMIADCSFGYGHGVSIGGQSNRGLDGMTVKNCYFCTGDCGLRLKADATQGGPVRNVSYTNLVNGEGGLSDCLLQLLQPHRPSRRDLGQAAGRPGQGPVLEFPSASIP